MLMMRLQNKRMFPNYGLRKKGVSLLLADAKVNSRLDSILPDRISCHSRLTEIPCGVLKNDSGQAGMTRVCVARQQMNTGYSNLLNALKFARS
jgi:hypothetical protein